MTLCKVRQNDTGTDPPQQQTAICNQRKAHFLHNWYNNNPPTPSVDSLELSTNPSQLRTWMHEQPDTHRSELNWDPAPYSLLSFPRGKMTVGRCWKRGRYTSTPPTRLHDVHSDAFSQFQLNPRTTLHDVMLYSVHATLPVRLQVRFMPASAKCRLASKPYEPRTVQFTVTRTVLPVQQSAYSSDMHTAEHCCNTRRPSPSNYRRRRNAGGRNAQGRNVWPRNSLHCLQHNAAVDCVSEQTRYCKRHRLTVWCNSHQRRTQSATLAHNKVPNNNQKQQEHTSNERTELQF
jgi:hypothetical protein